jgi:tRNA(fMet)-specific endonuclease VapC
MLANIRVLPYDDDAACRFAVLKVYLERRGERLDDADLQIASIALSSSAPLVTHNTRHFNRVPNLLLEDWLI